MENDVIELLDLSDFSSCKPKCVVLSMEKFKWLPELADVEDKADAEYEADVEEHGVVVIGYDKAVGAIEVSAPWDS